IQPKASTSMGHFSLAVKAVSGNTTEIRNLELDVGASADYDMPIFSLNPNTGTAGTNVSFSGSIFPASENITGITFGSANITLAQTITTSPQRTFSGAFTVPATVGGEDLAPGTYPVRVFVGEVQADAMFNVYGGDDTFILTLSPNFLQGEPGSTPETSGILKALGGATPTVKMAVKGLPPGVITEWNGNDQPIFSISAPPGGQNSFRLMLVLPGMIPMGQYPATLEGWVDTNQNNVWDSDEKITRVNLELSIMPPMGYGMGMLSLSPTYGQVGDTITFAGTGFPGNTAVESLTFAQEDVLTANITTALDGSFSGVFTVPDYAFDYPTGPGQYPVDVRVGTEEDHRMGCFDFQVVATDQKFKVSVSPGWLARPAGDIASVSISVQSLVTNPPSPTVILRVEGLPYGVTASSTSANVTPPVGGMEGRELQLTISGSCPMGNYPISIGAYNAANPAEEMWTDFTLEVTPSS
ncbi:MAG: IPT/TIG domain-containing protein, partial [Dehalococcoidales bacterium]|nr:IPT/TIG domain-containing protein [Dehalococcoidales bacterium]